MRRRFKLRLQVGWLALLIVLATLPALPAVQAAQNPALTLSIEIGYESYFRADTWLPVLIRVANGGADLRGELRVTAQDVLGASRDAYAVPIDLPTQADKQLFMYVAPDINAQQIRVELVTPDRVAATAIKDLKPIRPADMLFAVITDSPRGAIDLKRIQSGIGDALQANWRIANIPRLAEALDSLNGLLLADVDTGTLAAEQRAALADWVLSGGHLVVAGGPNWRKTAAGVLDLLPLEPDGSTSLLSIPALGTYAGQNPPQIQTDTPVILASGTLRDLAVVLAAQSGVPLVVRRPYGAGYVDYLAFDPNLEPFQSWAEQGDFWFMLFATSGQRPSWSGGLVSDADARAAADAITGLRFPDVSQLTFFLVLYAVVLGPLNYLVLRRIGRRELAWLTIPLLVIVFSVMYFFAGANLRGTRAIVNRMALVQVWENSERAEVTSVLGVAVPRRGQYSLRVAPGYTLQALTGDSDGGGLVAGKQTTIYEVGSYEARDFFIDAGTTAAFTTTGFTSVSPMDGTATIQLAAADANGVPGLSPARVTGEITNTTGLTLQDVVVLALGGSYELGDLAPGEKRTFNIAVRADQSPPVALGSGTWASAYYFRAAAFTSTPSNVTVRQIMGARMLNVRNPFGGRGFENTNDQQEIWRRQSFLDSLIVDVDPTGGRGTDVYVAGWTNVSPVDITLTGVPHETEDTALYIFRLPVQVQPAPDTAPGAVLELPNAYITWTPTERSTRRDASPYDLNIQAGERLVFRYMPMPLMKLESVGELRLLIEPGNATTRRITDAFSLWNWQTGVWEPITVENFLTRIEDPARFVGPNNTVEIKVEVGENVTRAFYERIDIALYGKLAQ